MPVKEKPIMEIYRKGSIYVLIATITLVILSIILLISAIISHDWLKGVLFAALAFSCCTANCVSNISAFKARVKGVPSLIVHNDRIEFIPEYIKTYQAIYFKDITSIDTDICNDMTISCPDGNKIELDLDKFDADPEELANTITDRYNSYKAVATTDNISSRTVESQPAIDVLAKNQKTIRNITAALLVATLIPLTARQIETVQECGIKGLFSGANLITTCVLIFFLLCILIAALSKKE